MKVFLVRIKTKVSPSFKISEFSILTQGSKKQAIDKEIQTIFGENNIALHTEEYRSVIIPAYLPSRNVTYFY